MRRSCQTPRRSVSPRQAPALCAKRFATASGARRRRAGSRADGRRLTGSADAGAGDGTAGPARAARGHRNDQTGAAGTRPPGPIVGPGTTGAAVPRSGTTGTGSPGAIARPGAGSPRPVARAWAARVEHAVVMVAVVVVLPNEGADEEHRGEDEHDARDDHHPGCRRVEPRRLDPRRRWRRGRSGRGGRGRLGLRFGCLAHAMPYCPARDVRNRPRRQIAWNRDVARRSMRAPGHEWVGGFSWSAQ